MAPAGEVAAGVAAAVAFVAARAVVGAVVEGEAAM